ncbi:MAG TPA: hypothetical protein VFS31_01660 [Chitinophagaceae bacterium]|nr:hypothetical protein [Chitinophagaceae bacterium]
MRWILIFALLLSQTSRAQWKDYIIGVNGDTLNRVDQQDRKQGPWVIHHDSLRGEPGFEEEGYFKNNRKEGEWRLFSLMGDLVGVENYRWGFKDGICRYYTSEGQLRLEQSWKALNPDKEYDTIDVEDPDHFDTYKQVVVKNEGAAIKHGEWKYYDPQTGTIVRTETYTLGKLENGNTANNQLKPTAPAGKIAKPKEVLEFEKRNSGKKRIKVKDGSTGGK